MGELRAVLFDVDDTLFSTTRFARKARTNAVRAMVGAGLDLPEEEVQRELDEVIAEFSSNYDKHYDQLLRRLRARAPLRVNPALIVAAGVAAYHDTKFRSLQPFEDVIPLLRFLGEAQVLRGVITHGWTIKQAEKLVRLGLTEHLEQNAIFISDQLGVSKPNPKLYGLALQELRLEPHEVMYVGDNPEHDVVPPQSLGMIAVWSRRAARHGIEGTGIHPDHVVGDFVELEKILRERYGVGSG